MRGLSQRTIELILFARALLQQFHPMTLRQLHYTVFSAAKIAYDNTPADYKRLSRVTTKARRLYRAWELETGEGAPPAHGFPHHWIIDELRQAERVNVWADLAGYMDSVKECYRRDNWQDQPNYCELWCEKAAVLGSVRPITKELGVNLRACRGYGSTGMEGQIGNLFEDIDKPITILYIGDHDASGDDIPRDMFRRGQIASGKEFRMVHLAIHASDIKAFNLPPQKIKEKDSRAKSFKKRFGKNAPTVELDALPVDELRRRVRSAIEGLIDFEPWNRQIDLQKVELACIADYAERVKSLPQVSET